MNKTIYLLIIGALSFIPLVANAETSKGIAVENFNHTQVSFSEKINVGASTLTISGPNNFFAVRSLESGLPSIELSNFGSVTDGLYKYQLHSAVEGVFKSNAGAPLNNGRANSSQSQESLSVKQSGNFRVINGSIMVASETSQQSGY